MNTWLKRYAFASLVVGASAIDGFAADSVEYRFGDWTVTVTPRDSQSAPLPKNETRAANSTVSNAAAIEINPLRKLKVVPASFNQEAASPPAPPMPMPDAPVAAPTPQLDAPVTTELPALQPNSVAPEIVPSRQACCDEPVITPRPSNALPPATVTTVPLALLYRDVYNSIPFSRVEYNNYHGYRHDATMSFLFNQLPTTVINRNSSSAVNYDYYGSGYLGYPYYDPPAYPFSYGLRIHRSR